MDLRGPGEQEPGEEGSSDANHRSASLPRSVCLSVSVLCLVWKGEAWCCESLPFSGLEARA